MHPDRFYRPGQDETRPNTFVSMPYSGLYPFLPTPYYSVNIEGGVCQCPTAGFTHFYTWRQNLESEIWFGVNALQRALPISTIYQTDFYDYEGIQMLLLSNEGDHYEFEAVVKRYHERFGYYPERILADKISSSRKNRGLCKRHGIRLSGPRLEKPGKNHMEEIRQELKETGERNAVEGKFGNGTRKPGLGLIMAN